MTAYQVMPGLTAEEYADLRADIAAHGIRVPIDVDENGQVLDGHHRSLIAAELGIHCPRRVLDGLSEAEKIAHALAVNVHRRSLTREQRRELLAASIKAEPEASDREHARRVGASDKTAGAVRAELEATAEIPQLAERTGADGKTRPAKVTQTTRTTEATKVEHDVDLATGEVLPPADAEPFDYEGDPDPVVRAIGRYPSLLYYVNERSKLLAIAADLDSFDGPELAERLAILDRSIAADQRRDEPPTPIADPGLPVDKAFRVATDLLATASSLTDDLVRDICTQVPHQRTSNWAAQFEDAAAYLHRLADACRGNHLRAVK